MHPKGNGWLGYVLTLDGDQTRYYCAGDTDQNPNNEAVSCEVALVPIGGTYTMDARQAAAFVNALRPRVAVPIHYGSFVGTYEDFTPPRRPSTPPRRSCVSSSARSKGNCLPLA